MRKVRIVAASMAAAALLVAPTSAQAATSSSNPFIKLRLQVLQPNCGSGILGTEGTYLLGAPVTICV